MAVYTVSTQGLESDEQFLPVVKALFAAGKEVHFEDGMDTKFSNDLIDLVESGGALVCGVIETLIINESVDPDVAGEALRWLGRMDSRQTLDRRRLLLEKCLQSKSRLVRDGALLGLASIDDHRSIQPLKDAIQREECVGLREDMEEVLHQLQSAG